MDNLNHNALLGCQSDLWTLNKNLTRDAKEGGDGDTTLDKTASDLAKDKTEELKALLIASTLAEDVVTKHINSMELEQHISDFINWVKHADWNSINGTNKISILNAMITQLKQFNQPSRTFSSCNLKETLNNISKTITKELPLGIGESVKNFLRLPNSNANNSTAAKNTQAGG